MEPFNYSNISNLVSGGKIFSVTFIKRTTCEPRDMHCSMGVRKHLKGGSKAYTPKDKNLLSVFDMEAKGYRSISIEAIQRLSVGGQTFNFSGAK